MNHKKLYSQKRIRRTNKDSARFAGAFEAAACRNSKMSLANIVVVIMDGEGCFTYKTDLEFAMDLDAFHSKRVTAMSDLLLAFGFSKELETKGRNMDQNAAFAKMLKRVLKHNPDMTIGEIFAEIVMGKNYCSYHRDEDLIRRLERI